jgi:IS1 family transposase
MDEIWSFTAAKQKNVAAMKKPVEGAGDTWTWTAIDADSKLILQWYVGDRSGETAKYFVDGVASRLATRVQLTTDGLKAYLEAVEGAFGADVDYAQLVKLYGASPESAKGRYSPAECTGIIKTPIEGTPDPKHISTSYVERQNLTMRMSMRRFTRLTNGFSKKLESHIYAISLYFVFYNFCRIHKTLKVTPAMAASITDKLMSMEDVVGLIDAVAPKPGRPATYKKRTEEISN